jgi:hypothetical protein
MSARSSQDSHVTEASEEESSFVGFRVSMDQRVQAQHRYSLGARGQLIDRATRTRTSHADPPTAALTYLYGLLVCGFDGVTACVLHAL